MSLVSYVSILSSIAFVGSSRISRLPLIPHHQHERRRQLSPNESFRRREDALQVGALYQGYGTHYIDLWVGTPGQRQTLIVDTGSGVTAFPCSGCGKCGTGHHIDDFFQESQSSTFSKVACGECKRGHCGGSHSSEEGCHIGMSYQEGSSWGAYEARDSVYIGGPHDHPLTSDNNGNQDIDPDHAYAFRLNMTFGCQTHLTGLFLTQLADGIMGMDDAGSSFWRQMFDAKMMSTKQFSLCFTRQPLADKKGTEAGAMTMGGFDKRLHTSPMIYTTREGGGSGFYRVKVRKIYLRDGSGGEGSKATDPNAQVINLGVAENELNSGNVIVDSGTTDTYFTRHIARQFRDAYRQLTGSNYHHDGMTLSEQQLRALPTILIQLYGDKEMNSKLYPKVNDISGFAVDVDPDNPYDVLLAVPPSHYMEYDEKQGMYVARFYADENSGSVLGANAMMGHDVFFDIDSARLGWAESDCNYHSLLTDNGFEDALGTSSDETTNSNQPDKTGDEHNGATQSDPVSSLHPALLACNDIACRGTVAGVLVAFLIMGLVIGRQCRQRGQSSRIPVMNGGEMEIPSLSKGQYRDDPVLEEENENGYRDDPAAPEGTGYRDEPPKAGPVV